MTRINRVLELMAKLYIDCVIIKDVTTIRYLTGFTGDSSLFYLDRKQGVLITDGRYTQQAKEEMKYFKVLEYIPVNANSIWQAAAELALKSSANVVGFDGAAYSYTDYVALNELLGEVPMESMDLSAIRMIKDKKELDLLVKAAAIADEAFMRLLEDIRPGRTERNLAGRLEYYMRSLGSEKTSFDTIVASGARSALPHGMASDKVVEVGDFITFDFGAVFKGYHSDMTRTIVLGMANSWQREIYTVVEEAQLKGMKAARPGMTGAELDAVVRKVITDCGYGDYYVHGTGHGVGLEIHEMPNINKRGDTVLRTGMIFTIEPGIYIPGKGGVRIEDTVVLTEEGAHALNGVKKQLIEHV
ncbi:aminopeptidase P family protein [Phascolarctobacterium sp.]|uniref:aminopeptidase P family protein n=1 Tax=Phascolarctobacterium sp. TaxID=2049039 RepID=UPI0038652CDA